MARTKKATTTTNPPPAQVSVADMAQAAADIAELNRLTQGRRLVCPKGGLPHALSNIAFAAEYGTDPGVCAHLDDDGEACGAALLLPQRRVSWRDGVSVVHGKARMTMSGPYQGRTEPQPDVDLAIAARLRQANKLSVEDIESYLRRGEGEIHQAFPTFTAMCLQDPGLVGILYASPESTATQTPAPGHAPAGPALGAGAHLGDDVTSGYLHALTKLVPGQFAQVMFKCGVDKSNLSGPSAPQAIRATELLTLMANNGHLPRLRSVLEDTVGPGSELLSRLPALPDRSNRLDKLLKLPPASVEILRQTVGCPSGILPTSTTAERVIALMGYCNAQHGGLAALDNWLIQNGF